MGDILPYGKRLSSGNEEPEGVPTVAFGPRRRVEQTESVPSIGERIQAAISELGLTDAEVAAKAGVSGATLSRYKSGERENPQVSELAKVARALGVTIDWLCDGSEPRARVTQGEPELSGYSWPPDISEGVRLRALQRVLVERDAHRRALVPYWHDRLSVLIDDEKRKG